MSPELKYAGHEDGAERVEAVDGTSYEETSDVLEPTKEEQAAVIKKLDRRLLPFVLILYSFAILDRSNLGNAKLAGLTKSINLGGLRYNWLGTVFYITYILFQWQTVCWKKFPPHLWAVWTIIFWGTVSSAQAATTTWSGLMVCRALLGIAEAGFGPGVPLYLSYFYPKDKIAFRQGVFISGAALANAYGGALAYGITQIKGSIASWKILFLIEGLPTVILAVGAFFLLPDSIAEAKFLTPREKEVARICAGRNQVLDAAGDSSLKLRQLLAGFADLRSYIPAGIYFGINVSYASLPLFVPTIISELGIFSLIQSQGLSSPPYVLAFFVILGMTWLSDRVQLRGPLVSLCALVAAVGFLLLAVCTSPVARYVGVFLAVIIFTCVPLTLGWVSNIHATESKRAGGYVVLSTIGQCGPVLGTNIFPMRDRPFYRRGMWISFAMCLVVAVLAAVLDLWLAYDNRKMDKQEREEGVRPGDLEKYDVAAPIRERRVRYVI